jgi:hypothetical protein
MGIVNWGALAKYPVSLNSNENTGPWTHKGCVPLSSLPMFGKFEGGWQKGHPKFLEIFGLAGGFPSFESEWGIVNWGALAKYPVSLNSNENTGPWTHKGCVPCSKGCVPLLRAGKRGHPKFWKYSVWQTASLVSSLNGAS